MLLGGAALYAAGLLVMATAGSQAALSLSGMLIGLGVAGSGFTAVLGVVGRAAPPEKRALAISLTSMGSAIGQFVALPYTHVLISETGWVISLLVLAGTAAIMAPLGFALGSGPDGARAGVSPSLRRPNSVSARRWAKQ